MESMKEETKLKISKDTKANLLMRLKAVYGNSKLALDDIDYRQRLESS